MPGRPPAGGPVLGGPAAASQPEAALRGPARACPTRTRPAGGPADAASSRGCCRGRARPGQPECQSRVMVMAILEVLRLVTHELHTEKLGKCGTTQY